MFDQNSTTGKYANILKNINPIRVSGRITKVIGLVLESEGPKARIGEVCILKNRAGKEVTKSEIVGFRDNTILSMILGDLDEIITGMEIFATGEALTVNVGDALLGRILDGLGNPIDDKGKIRASSRRSIYAIPPNPLQRQRINQPLSTGIRAIDGLISLGKGQRIV